MMTNASSWQANDAKLSGFSRYFCSSAKEGGVPGTSLQAT